MSEHMAIKGKIEFQHLPYDWEGGFAYCNRCKDVCEKAIIELHQGATADWIQFICSKCNKTIWIASLYDEKGEEASKVLIKDDKKCCICGKPTNHYDCVMNCMGTNNPKLFDRKFIYGKDTVYVCSKKCLKKFDKIKNSAV